MLVVLSGTNRPNSRSRAVAGLAQGHLKAIGREVTLLDLRDLPAGLFAPEAYVTKPEGFARFQDAVLAAKGIITVVPEYNGSYPGVLKYFIDMLRFPESLVGTPTAFIGIAAGPNGGLRAVEQLEMVFQYRNAHLFGRRLFIAAVNRVLDDGRLHDPAIEARLHSMLAAFDDFCRRLSGP